MSTGASSRDPLISTTSIVKFKIHYFHGDIMSPLLSKQAHPTRLFSRSINEAERFDIIKFNLKRFENLGVMGGYLSKCSYDETFEGDKLMHILELPAIVKSIGLLKELRLDTYSEMVGFTRTGKFFVTGPFNDEPKDFQSRALGIVDTRTKPMQYTRLLKFDNNMLMISTYVPSLVSPIPIEEP